MHPIRVKLDEVKDDDGLQFATGWTQSGEQVKNIVRAQPHGMTSHPPKGSIGIVQHYYGRRDMPVMIGVEHPDKRPKNTPAGGTVIYDAHGNIASIVQQSMRIVHSTEIKVIAPDIILEGRVHLGGKGGPPVDRTDNNPATKVTAI